MDIAGGAPKKMKVLLIAQPSLSSLLFLSFFPFLSDTTLISGSLHFPSQVLPFTAPPPPRRRMVSERRQQQMLQKIYLPRIFMDFWVKEAPRQSVSQSGKNSFTPTLVGQAPQLAHRMSTWARNKTFYVVAWNFFPLLLDYSAWPCMGPA